MSTVREHLKKAHEAIAMHHREMVKCHTAAMGKNTDPHHEFHKAAAAAHTAAAETHEEMCNDCQKAADSELTKLVPTNVSGVTPGFRAVPRSGQREIPAAGAKPNVDSEFQDMFKVETGEERSLS
jgi:hypothetical protein